MKITIALFTILFVLNTQAQKVVKPVGNTNDTFSLSINNIYYKNYIAEFVNRPVYKNQWPAMIKADFPKGTSLSAKIKLLISVQHDGKVFVEDHYSIVSDTTLVSAEAFDKLVLKIRDDLRKEIKKKGVVTPAFSTYHNHYVNDETVLEYDWAKEL